MSPTRRSEPDVAAAPPPPVARPRSRPVPHRGDDPAQLELPALVKAAAAGDEAAWEKLVTRHSRLLWAVARSVGLSASDAADVCQTTWMQLVRHASSIHDPDRIGAWLATTARREAILISRRSRRDIPSGDDPVLEQQSASPVIDLTDAALARDERVICALRAAIAELPERSRQLLALLATDPVPPYAEISRRLDMPIGSIGPTRARALERLRRSVVDRGIAWDDVMPFTGC